jgi:predicted PurR-regulated permease PerM
VSVQEPEALPSDVGGESVDPPLSRVPGWLMRLGTSAWLVLGIIALAVVLYLGFAQISGLVAPLVIAVVIGMLFHPLVDRMVGARVGRSVGAALILLAITMVVLFAIYLSVRGIFDQSDEIAAQLQQGWLQIKDWLSGIGLDLSRVEEAVSSVGSNAGGGVSGLVSATVSSVGAFLVGLFIGAFILYYLLKDWHGILGWAAGHMGLPRDLGAGLIEDATTSIRQYFYALTLTSIPIAIVIGVVMWALGLPLAFTIALVTFVTAYIPYLGAIFSGAFATLVALGSGGVSEALVVLVVVLLTQNLMQTLLLTRLSSSSLQIHPIVNLASTIIGATLAGIIGATLSAPLVAMVLAANRRVRAYRWGSVAEDPRTDG